MTTTSKDPIQVPDKFICPLTLECMFVPMVTRSGHCFERAAIVAWLAEHRTHPLTREPMSLRDIVHYRALQKEIASWKLSSAGLLPESDTEESSMGPTEEDPIFNVHMKDVDEYCARMITGSLLRHDASTTSATEPTTGTEHAERPSRRRFQLFRRHRS